VLKQPGRCRTRATKWHDFARRRCPAVLRLSAMSDDPAIRHGTIVRIFDAVTTLALCALFVFVVSVLMT
jgi:hypothetical protein